MTDEFALIKLYDSFPLDLIKRLEGLAFTKDVKFSSNKLRQQNAFERVIGAAPLRMKKTISVPQRGFSSAAGAATDDASTSFVPVEIDFFKNFSFQDNPRLTQ